MENEISRASDWQQVHDEESGSLRKMQELFSTYLGVSELFHWVNTKYVDLTKLPNGKPVLMAN